MAFEKGKPRPENAGRKKGSVNKTTADVKARIERVIDNLDKNIDADIKKLTPDERVRLWKDLQEYIVPKLSRTQIAGDPEQPLEAEVKIDVTKLSDQTLQELAGIYRSNKRTG